MKTARNIALLITVASLVGCAGMKDAANDLNRLANAGSTSVGTTDGRSDSTGSATTVSGSTGLSFDVVGGSSSDSATSGTIKLPKTLGGNDGIDDGVVDGHPAEEQPIDDPVPGNPNLVLLPEQGTGLIGYPETGLDCILESRSCDFSTNASVSFQIDKDKNKWVIVTPKDSSCARAWAFEVTRFRFGYLNVLLGNNVGGCVEDGRSDVGAGCGHLFKTTSDGMTRNLGVPVVAPVGGPPPGSSNTVQSLSFQLPFVLPAATQLSFFTEFAPGTYCWSQGQESLTKDN
jgi:hypothetical protein